MHAGIRSPHPAIIALTTLCGLLVVGGSVVLGGGSDTYTGCLKSNGELAKVAIGTSPSSPCSTSETQVSWNEQGVEGPAGPQGEAGPAGPQGEDSIWLKGIGDPTPALGTNGDFYLNLTSGAVFYKESDVWLAGPNLVGPQGPQGEQGLQGPTGPAGPTGDAGGSAVWRMPASASVITTNSPGFQTIDTIQLPQNAYALFYNASIQLSDTAIEESGRSRTICRLMVDGSERDRIAVDPGRVVNVLTGATGGGYPILTETTFTLQAAVQSTGSPVAVVVDCQLAISNSTASSAIHNGQLIAIGLGSLTISNP